MLNRLWQLLTTVHPFTNAQFPEGSAKDSNQSPDVDTQIALEHLRQAQCSFNLALTLVGASAVISFAGVGLLLSGKTSEGAVAASSSVISSICHLQLVKDANERLAKSASALKEKE